jgi:hypothetical protein
MWARTIVLFVLLANAKADSFKMIKVWSFTLPHGSLKIDLREYSEGYLRMSIGPSGQIRMAPIAEQVEPLKQVLGELSSLGLDPKKLTYMGTRLFTEDIVEKLAYACVDSQEWRSSIRNHGKGKEDLVVQLLNRSGVFEPYNEAFKLYGLRVEVAEAENVFLVRFSEFPARDSHDHADKNVLVPADAMLGMEFSQIDASHH